MAVSEPPVQSQPVPEPQPAPAGDSDPGVSPDSAPAEDQAADGAPSPANPSPQLEGAAGAEQPQAASIVVQCPNCQSSFPLTSETEAVLPPLSDRYTICGECEGTTWVRTHSLDAEFAVRRCEGCGGSGYLRKDGLPSTTTTPAGIEPPWAGATWDEDRQLWV